MKASKKNNKGNALIIGTMQVSNGSLTHEIVNVKESCKKHSFKKKPFEWGMLMQITQRGREREKVLRGSGGRSILSHRRLFEGKRDHLLGFKGKEKTSHLSSL